MFAPVLRRFATESLGRGGREGDALVIPLTATTDRPYLHTYRREFPNSRRPLTPGLEETSMLGERSARRPVVMSTSTLKCQSPSLFLQAGTKSRPTTRESTTARPAYQRWHPRLTLPFAPSFPNTRPREKKRRQPPSQSGPLASSRLLVLAPELPLRRPHRRLHRRRPRRCSRSPWRRLPPQCGRSLPAVASGGSRAASGADRNLLLIRLQPESASCRRYRSGQGLVLNIEAIFTSSPFL